ncbi:MAG: Smr/MutS family protein, partial [Dehalococcoidia bacterium]|nr:Smr/MutS family protein [Dehalococcoidia bacterium]
GPEPETPNVQKFLAPSLESLELDLRGLRVDDAQIRLDDFLDHSVRDSLSKIRVIHGRGTGALRNVVREHLRHHRAVRNFGPEPRERGGNGATWVELA